MSRRRSDFFAVAMFGVSLVLLAFGYGFAVGKFNIFPYDGLQQAFEYGKELKRKLTGERSWLYARTPYRERIPVYDPDAAYRGLNLVTAVDADRRLAVYVMDMAGNTVHSWDVDWSRIWPDARHLSAAEVPRGQPGTHIHGAVVLDDGDIVYNYEHQGLVRLGLCGEVVWRLPYRTHHSVELDDDGDLWVSAQLNRIDRDRRFPNYQPRYIEPVLLEVSQDGQIKSEISVLELLRNNDLSGLLYMSATDNESTTVTGDTLHLNDVEPFLSSMQPGAFVPGDLLVSLRNIHTVLVFTPATGRIKHVWTGEFVRQHDPDFVDGNTISVYDNDNVGKRRPQSRILLLSADSHVPIVYYPRDRKRHFYSDIMGKHQWLPNGNLLISESMSGRAFEINRDGRIVWEYVNLAGDGYAAVMEEVLRLPERVNLAYSHSRISDKCTAHADPSGGSRDRQRNGQ